MRLFPSGIAITGAEHKSLLHIDAEPEQWLQDAITEKARLRRDALINEWRPRLFADPMVTELPANADELAVLILARSDYKTRLEADTAERNPVPPSRRQKDRFAAKPRLGPKATLFPAGIEVSDVAVACILAYVQDLDEWVIGALLGHINRGKKKMIREYHQVLMDDGL